MNRNKDKKEIDPELLMKIKFRLKCRFRAIGRLAMANVYWLSEGLDVYEGDDVKRRVEQAVRGKKKKQLLSLADKALLNKPAEDRTEQEKKYIYRIIGGLKCFKRYPNHVKRKLAAVTYYKYYGPNRVIVRQHHEAHAMYFIIAGKVSVSHLVYDELLQQNVPVEIGTILAGDMFGEVSLLHNIPRTATVTTVEHCEFLTLLGPDFKNVLQVSVQKQWDEVRKAMSAFTYFDGLDDVSRREGCIVAKLKSYQINDTLLGDGNGVANHVYFILSGHCQIIESLQIFVTHQTGHTYYTLFDPYISPEQSEQDLDKKYFLAYKNLNKSRESGDSRKSRTSNLSNVASASARRSILHKETEPKRKSSVQIAAQGSSGTLGGQNKSNENAHEPTRRVSLQLSKQEGDDSAHLLQSKMELKRRHSGGSKSLSYSEITKCHQIKSESQINVESKDILVPLGEGGAGERLSSRFSTIPEEPLKKLKKNLNLRTYFMQVCQLNPGASFGFGENMRDRRVIALTPVDCMLMPKVWLLQRNTANIWTRIQHYLERKIPTKKQLFREFVNQMQWEDFRDMLVEDVVASSNVVNYTSVHDVPYSIRLEEMFDTTEE